MRRSPPRPHSVFVCVCMFQRLCRSPAACSEAVCTDGNHYYQLQLGTSDHNTPHNNYCYSLQLDTPPHISPRRTAAVSVSSRGERCSLIVSMGRRQGRRRRRDPLLSGAASTSAVKTSAGVLIAQRAEVHPYRSVNELRPNERKS